MKVWEKAAKEMTEQLKHNYTTRHAVKSDMYMMRVLPCDYNESAEIFTKEKMGEICQSHEIDCYKCFEAFLDMEVPE